MIKKVFGLLLVVAVMASCANNKEQKKPARPAGGEESCCDKEKVAVTVDEVMSKVETYVDKEIVIKGTVNHVCSHGGKRMFIMGTDPDVAIKITPNDEIGVFEKELEGSHVKVTGTMKELRIDEAYVANLEKEDNESEALHDHSGGTHEETEEAKEQKQHQLDAMREQIAESENGYYSQFWIEASKFEVVECEHEQKDAECEGEDHEHKDAECEGDDHEHKDAECEGDEHEHEHAEGEEHTH